MSVSRRSMAKSVEVSKLITLKVFKWGSRRATQRSNLLRFYWEFFLRIFCSFIVVKWVLIVSHWNSWKNLSKSEPIWTLLSNFSSVTHATTMKRNSLPFIIELAVRQAPFIMHSYRAALQIQYIHISLRERSKRASSLISRRVYIELFSLQPTNPTDLIA